MAEKQIIFSSHVHVPLILRLKNLGKKCILNINNYGTYFFFLVQLCFLIKQHFNNFGGDTLFHSVYCLNKTVKSKL